MVQPKKELVEFCDLFGIDLSVDESDQSEEYGHSKETTEPFEKLKENFSSSLENIQDKGKSMGDIHQEVKEICKDDGSKKTEDMFTGEPEVKKQIIEEASKELILSDDEYEKNGGIKDEWIDDDTEEETTEEKNDKEEDGDGASVETEPEPNKSDSINSRDFEETTRSNDRPIEWKLDSPASLYSRFYEYKRKKLYDMLIGGPLPFGRLFQELDDIKIDISSESFNKEEVDKKMQITQAYRERLKQISLMVYKQYYLWKRFVPIFEGKLALVQYLKPIVKQQGLEGEHLDDCYTYLALLEGLHDSVDTAEKTLSAAYETLSRKVSIYMPLIYREISNTSGWLAPNITYMPVQDQQCLSNNTNKIDKEDRDDVEKDEFEFDKVPDGAKVNAKKSEKIGVVEWSEINKQSTKIK